MNLAASATLDRTSRDGYARRTKSITLQPIFVLTVGSTVESDSTTLKGGIRPVVFQLECHPGVFQRILQCVHSHGRERGPPGDAQKKAGALGSGGGEGG
jgi:hypothetical protein